MLQAAEKQYEALKGTDWENAAKINMGFFPLIHDFLRFALNRYPDEYAATGLLGPTTTAPVVPDNALPVYQQAIDEAAKVTGTALMPWDTQLDPTTNTKLVQEQVLLVQGDVGVDEFIQTMDAALAENAPAYFAQ